MSAKTRAAWVLGGALLGGACSSGPGSEPPGATVRTGQPAAGGPAVRVLGTVQDGGLPHAACDCDRCQAARHDASRRRRIASLAILLPEPRRVFLIDATPDIRAQLDAVSDWAGSAEGRVDRAPVDGILLTHAHIGHYTGLAFFGFEAIHSRELPLFCSPSMAAFLTHHGPWGQLVKIGNVVLRELAPGEPLELGQTVSVTALSVPHRDEYSDTVGYVVRGPRRSLLYVPDTDSWNAWDPSLPSVLEGIDVAILDGSFFSADELPGRPVSSIGHPLITESMDLLEPMVATGRLQVYFTHLNHSNPALDPQGAARSAIEARGFSVLEEGVEFEL